jgi:hypothetical protein
MLPSFKYRTSPPFSQIIHPEGLISASRLFKCLALLLGYLFLAVVWQFSQNGRYVAVQDSDRAVVVVDTRTGEVSWPKNNQPQAP